MDTCLRTLCMTVVLASIPRRLGALGPVIRCDPCDAAARLLCKPLPRDCAQSVREPGCGCCLTCALVSGQPCGVYTGRCGSGMSCQQQPGETKPLQALLEGRGVCANATSRRTISIVPPVNEIPESVGDRDEERNVTRPAAVPPLQTPASTRRPPGPPPPRPPPQQQAPAPPPQAPPLLHPAKAELIRRGQLKRAQSFKMEELRSGAPLDAEQQNFSVENKQEPEYGPCRREMESVLNGLKITDFLNPRGFRIPNCDKKGFYKKRQCRPSKGRKRGFCWCVDKYGQPLPGFDGRERGDALCYNSESQ